MSYQSTLETMGQAGNHHLGGYSLKSGQINGEQLMFDNFGSLVSGNSSAIAAASNNNLSSFGVSRPPGNTTGRG